MRDQETPLPPTLDRVWAATRPADLTGDEFDRIWAEVTRSRDRGRGRPTLLPFAPSRRRALTIASLGLAQVAAVVAVAFVVMRRDPDVTRVGPPVASRVAPVKVHDLKVESDEVVMVMLAEGRVDYRRTQADSGADLALLDVPAVNPVDQLNQWEAMAQ